MEYWTIINIGRPGLGDRQTQIVIGVLKAKETLAALTAFAIVMLFVQHPSVHPHHAGAAAILIAVIFVTSAVVGARVPTKIAVSAVALLAFTEPGILVTRSLSFDVVANGLLIGATVSAFRSLRMATGSRNIVMVFIAFSAIVTVLPLLASGHGWIHTHDAVMFLKYSALAALSLIIHKDRDIFHWIMPAVVIGASAAALLTVIQALRIGSLNQLIFSTYLSNLRLSPVDINHFATTYTRAWGVIGPVETAVLLSISVGAFIGVIIRLRSQGSVWVPTAALTFVLAAIFLTGSRLGMAAAGTSLLVAMYVSAATKTTFPNWKRMSVAVIAVIAVLTVVGSMNEALSGTASTSISRVARTPSAIFGDGPDASLQHRLPQYSQIVVVPLGDPTDRDTDKIGEFSRIAMRFGFIGLFGVWWFWTAMIKRSFHRIRYSRVDSGKIAGAAALISITAALITSLGASVLFSPAIMTVLIVLVCTGHGITFRQLQPGATNDE